MYYLSFSSTNPSYIRAIVFLLSLLGCALLFSVPPLFAQETVPEPDTSTPQEEEVTSQPETTSVPEEETETTTVEPETSAEEEVPAEDTETSVIDTGDADALLDSETDVNTNDTSVTETVDVDTGQEVEPSEDTRTVPTEEVTDDSTSTDSVPPESDTTVTNDNTAELGLTAEVSAQTGDNSAVNNHEVLIDTGNAISTANIVNVVNTNIFNSTGMFYLLNLLLGNISLDTRDMFSILTGESEVEGGCTDTDPCAPGDTTVTIHNTNSAVIDNTLEVIANTGGNAAGASGASGITTGDAYASANVINLVNTNITDTNYLLLTVNSFDTGNGGIIFPGADWFYELLGQGSSVPRGSQTTIENTNIASIDNTVEVVANTGSNEASGEDSSVTTGNAYAQTSVVNKVNTNIFGSSISLLFNIQGSWAGDIFGLPEGMSWQETATGVEIFFDGDTVQAPAGSTDNLTVKNTNDAEINNNVSVFALTGDNMAESEEDTASIETGTANASANIVNIANTNVLGQNWVLAIFNILGDWDGNISFGQPDLWIGVRTLSAPKQIFAGACFEYEYTVNNFGDADVHNVVLYSDHSPLQQMIGSMQEESDGKFSHYIGDIDKGDSITFSLPVCISKHAGGGRNMTTAFQVLGTEEDADYANNTDIISITTAKLLSSELVFGRKEAILDIQKVADKKTVTASSTVTYEITIKNGENPIHNALLIDTIFDPNNRPIHEQRWGLGTVLKNETIIVSYEAFFNEDSAHGMYINEAFISGTTRDPIETVENEPINSPVAQIAVEVVEDMPKATCSPLLETYISPSGTNSRDEVGELQFFLRTIEGDTTVSLTKEYDAATIRSVHAFQMRYADDILTPWGMTESSGYVYYTTQKKVNELWCDDIDFSLTEKQVEEMQQFKERTRSYIERHVELPEETFEHFGDSGQETPVPANTQNTEEAIQNEEQPLVNLHQIATAEAATAGVDVISSLFTTLRTNISNSLLFFSF